MSIARLAVAGCLVACGACAYPEYGFVPDEAGGAGDDAEANDGAIDGTLADARDAASDGATDDSTAIDTAVVGDTTAVDTLRSDTTTTDTAKADDGAAIDSLTCDRIGVTCPSATPWCTLKVVAGGKWANTCATSPGTRGLDAACDPAVGGCADGLNCMVVYPDPSPFFRCEPLCKTTGDCPAKYPFCSWQLDGIVGGKQCGQCDPTRQMVPDCPGSQTCMATSSALPPSCHPPGLFAEGTTCGSVGTACAAGLICVCETGTTSAVGDACAAVASPGVCRKACLPYYAPSTNGCTGSQHCTLTTTSDYAYCK